MNGGEITGSRVGLSGSPGGRFAVAATSLACAALLLTVLNLHGLGERSRVSPVAVIHVADSRELVDALAATGTRGVVVLSATADLGYSPVQLASPSDLLRWPIETRDLREHYTAGVSRVSWGWVLAKTGIARRIDYLMPSAAYRVRVDEGRSMGFPGISADGTHIVANDEGYLRFISDRTSPSADSYVLIVDASYFQEGTAVELSARLAELPVPPRAVVTNAAQDDPEVSAGARAALDELRPRLETLVSHR